MDRKLFFSFIASMILLLCACEHISNKIKKNTPAKISCDSCCLNKLAVFADTLNIDTSKLFNYYFDEKHFSLGDCSLKKFRGSPFLKSSLVLIWLKIDHVFLKHHWNYSYVEDIGDISKTAHQIVFEFYYLATNKDVKWIEFLDPSWVNSLIKTDPVLLKNTQIRRLFKENGRLRRHQKSPYS